MTRYIAIVALLLGTWIGSAFAAAPEVPFVSMQQLKGSIPGWTQVGSQGAICGGRHPLALITYAMEGDSTQEQIWGLFISTESLNISLAYFPKGSEAPTYLWFGTYKPDGAITFGAAVPYDKEKSPSPCANWHITS